MFSRSSLVFYPPVPGFQFNPRIFMLTNKIIFPVAVSLFVNCKIAVFNYKRKAKRADQQVWAKR